MTMRAKREPGAQLVRPDSVVSVPLQTSTEARDARAARPLLRRQPWFWLYLLTGVSAVAFWAFAVREGYAADAELRSGGWVLGETVTLVVGLVAFVAAVVLHRRRGRR